MTDVIIASAAEVDYTESLTWYAERSVDPARDFDAEFDRALAQIAADPERCAMLDTDIIFYADFHFASSTGWFVRTLS